MPRVTAVTGSSFAAATIGVIIPSYNYGHFLPEAVESALRQTRPANRILIADDCSGDDTQAVGKFYADKYPDRVSYVRNPENYGMVRNFNQAVNAIGTDYVVLLGADNRFRSDYLEQCSRVLDENPDVGVAYPDFALFGPRAVLDAEAFDSSFRRPPVENTFYPIIFPEFDQIQEKTRAGLNVLHGSSMFRKTAFDTVGGYRNSAQAEDHNLFSRIVAAGFHAQHVAGTFLEYRKHSSGQGNVQFITQTQLNFYRELVREKDRRIDDLTERLARRSLLVGLFVWLPRKLLSLTARLLPQKVRGSARERVRKFFLACERCEHPVFKLRFYVPESLRKRVGKAIWRIQQQYFR